MLKVTASRPELVIPWMELGLAQLCLKKYTEVENSFKVALGSDAHAVKASHSDDFYQQSNDPGDVAPTATHQSRNTMGGTVTTGQARPPEVLGTAYASLGEIYIHGESLRSASGL